MWNLINKVNKIKRLIDTGNRLTAVREEGVGELGEIGKMIKQKYKIKFLRL